MSWNPGATGPSAPVLTERQRVVLHTVIAVYVSEVRPVASRRVAERSGLALSPASIRSAMAELTELGLLAQPHVSAGRVPTHAGFRCFVDELLHQETPASLLMRSVELGEPESGPSDLMQRAADQLSRATGQVGFYVGRPGEDMVLERIHFVRASSERVAALLVSAGGLVQSRLIEDADCDLRTLERVSAAISELVSGYSLAEARGRLATRIELERALSDELQRKVLVLGWEGLAGPGEAELYLSDRQQLLAQPEFGDLAHLRALLGALEEKERMIRLLDKVLTANVNVAIGEELDDPGMRACALVAVPVGSSAGAGLGVIGPVRMPYERVITAVRYVSGRVTDYLC